jgi:hypothetical protein
MAADITAKAAILPNLSLTQSIPSATLSKPDTNISDFEVSGCAPLNLNTAHRWIGPVENFISNVHDEFGR